MSIFVEWYPAHLVDDEDQMKANQAWAEQCYRMLRDGGFIGTSHGVYVKRNGGLYQIKLPLPEDSR